MASWLLVKLMVVFLFSLCLQHRGLEVSAQCNDYSVSGLRDGYLDSCICDVQVAEIPGCTSPPSQSELDELDDIQNQVNNVSSRVVIVRAVVDQTTLEITTTQNDLAVMTAKLDSIESGDLKVSMPEFDLIVEEIELLEEVLVLLEADRTANLETVNTLETELGALEQRLHDLWKTQDVEALMQQIDQLEGDLAACQASIPTPPPPGSGDNHLFFPWEDVGTQDSCGSIAFVSSPYTVRTDSYVNGAWTRDPFFESDKIWHYPYYTSCTNYKYAYRYPNFDSYDRQASTEAEIYTLRSGGVGGPGLVAYNGSFYFSSYNSKTMNRYNYNTNAIMVTNSLADSGYGSSSTYQYKGQGCTAIDYAVDESGLWVIYTSTSAGNLMKLSRLNIANLEVIESWTLNFPKNSFGDCFVICAKLYCVDDYQGETVINFMFDTQTEVVTSPNIPFRIRYGKMYSLDYNPRDQKLYGWDNGKMVLYDVTFGN